MSIKKNIRIILMLTLWTVLSAGVLVLLVAAKNIKSHKACRQLAVRINGVKDFYFLDRKDIIQMITDAGINNPVGRPVATFNLSGLEASLERNVWVKDAELFFDNNLVLHVIIMEREPVARLFTITGGSFYIDTSGFRMPLSEKMTVKVPVFTGFPSDNATLNRNDSLLMVQIKNISRYVFNNGFWMAQIAQIDITPGGAFSMAPTIGNHVIAFGDGENYESKFRRLFGFYQQVLSRTGFDKYSNISVQYDRQVVATRKGPMPKIDSLKALKNIASMIVETMKITEDSAFMPEESVPAGQPAADSALGITDSSVASPEAQPLLVPDNRSSTVRQKPKTMKPAAVKPVANRSEGTAPTAKAKPIMAVPVVKRVQPKPKAVMRKIGISYQVSGIRKKMAGHINPIKQYTR